MKSALVGVKVGPEGVEVSIQARAPRVPEAVRAALDRLKAVYDGFRYRDLARILFITCGVSIDHKTVKALWQATALACQEHLGLWDYHAVRPENVKLGRFRLCCAPTANRDGRSFLWALTWSILLSS